MATYSTAVTTGIVLSNPATQNPTTITATGYVTNTAAGDAIYGNNAAAWTLSNYGTINATAGYSGGINLIAGGLVINAAGALIAGPDGVQISGAAGTVLNAGTIMSTDAYGVRLDTGGTLSNVAGTVGSAQIIGSSVGVLLLNAGGSVNNGRLASAAATISGAVYGVWSRDAAATVTNYGTIAGTAAAGIFLYNGGLVTNAAGGVVASSNRGIQISNAVGSVDNTGTVQSGVTAAAVALGAGGAVTNRQGGTIAGGGGVQITGQGTLSNLGTITASSTSGFGVVFTQGGSIQNGSTAVAHAVIAGTLRGVQIYGTVPSAAGTVTNFGTIAARVSYAAALYLQAGGTVTNQLGGLIGRGGVGINVGTNTGTVTNFGTLTGTYGTGVLLGSGGGVANSGLISGTQYGVNVGAGTGIIDNSGTIAAAGVGVRLVAGTVTNAGSIAGGGGTAVLFGTGDDRLVLKAGFGFSGGITGGAGSDTLELDGSGGALTVDYNALALTSFESVLFGAGNNATLRISNTSGTLGVAISGFDATTETIDLTAIGADGQVTNHDTVNNRVTITGSLGGVTLQLDPSDGTAFTTAPDSADGTNLSIACFCRGTGIRTPTGETPVEELAIGDRVMTISGAARPIKWVGKRAYDPRFVAGNRNVLPIRIEVDALAQGVPARDLWVSPEHALYLRQVLVPAHLLVNDATITQPESVDRLEYFHIDLGTHDVILAEGAAVETYVDCDNRGMFHNEREFARLYPGETPPRWEFCARRIAEGSPELAAIRRGVIARAEVFGRFTDDPDLHLVIDGITVPPQLIANRHLYRFAVPAGGGSIVLASRSTVPMKIERSSADGRRLGVAVEQIVLRGTGLSVEIGADCPSLCNGFHDAELGYRWTDGRGYLPAGMSAAFRGDIVMEVHLAETECVYGLETPATALSRVGQ